ncbi:MAG: conjugal transfer protein TraO [Bacteroidales bacterium]
MRGVAILMSVVLGLLSAERAEAQCCLPGMRGVQVMGGVTDGYFEGNGGLNTGYFVGVSSAKYLKNCHKMTFGVNYLNRGFDYASERLSFEHFTFEMGYLRNLLADGGKSFFVSIGCSGVVGYEYINKGKTLLSDGARLQDEDAFIYGVSPCLELEYYLCDYVVLVASANERIVWGGSTGHFHLQLGVGLRFIIN